MVEIISEEKYNAMSLKEKNKYDKKLERQLDKEAKKGFDNAVWTYEKGAQVAATGAGVYSWYNYFNNENEVEGGKKRRKSLKKKRKTRRKKGGGPAMSVLPSVKDSFEQIKQVLEKPPRQPSLKPHSKPILLEAAEGLLKLTKGKKGGKRKGRKSLKKTKRRKTRRN